MDDQQQQSTAASSSDAFNNGGRPLAKSNSILSHMSIPFTGAFPIGNLKVVRPSDSILEAGSQSGCEQPAGDDSSLPPSTRAAAAKAPGEGSDALAGLPLRPVRAASPCLRKGDVFLAIGLQRGFVMGCDAMAMVVQHAQESAACTGLRDLPGGAHIFWVSPPGAMSRQGYWFVTRPEGDGDGIVRIKQWDRYSEVFGDCAIQYEARSLADDVESYYPKLVPYKTCRPAQPATSSRAAGADRTTAAMAAGSLPPSPLPLAKESSGSEPASVTHATDVWPILTSCLTESLLSRVTGKNPGADRAEWPVTTVDAAKGELAVDVRKFSTSAEFDFLFPGHEPDPYRLMDTNARADRGSIGSTGSRGTGAAMDAGTGADIATEARPSPHPATLDSTRSIIAMLENSPAGYVEDDIVGELQFVFLTGVLLSNLACLEQWWHLVLKVVLRARRLATCRPALARTLIQTMHAQFIYLDLYVAGGFSGASPSTASSSATAATASATRLAAAPATTTTTPLEQEESGENGIFDVKPHGAARLRASLTAYKRRLNEALLGLGNSVTPEEAAVGQAFSDLEAWLWKYGWDLRSDYVPGPDDNEQDVDDDDDETASRFIHGYGYNSSGGNRGQDGHVDDGDFNFNRWSRRRKNYCDPVHHEMYDSDDDEDQPVLVELDEDGRQVGLISWD